MNFFKLLYAASGLSLATFGNVSDLIQKENPWRGFDSKEAWLLVVRIEKLDPKDCPKWVTSIQETLPEAWSEGQIGSTRKCPDSVRTTQTMTPSSLRVGLENWEPWEKDEIGNTQCSDFPCAVKLNQSETKQLEAIQEKERFQKYQDLIVNRVNAYRKTEARKEYEFPGDPINPWDFFQKQGYLSRVELPKTMHLGARKLNLASDQIKIIRQVLDRRVGQSLDGMQATVWIRDAYNDHYFDSWGEWANVSCNPKAGPTENFIIQALFIELDLLKKTDLVSQIFHGKMKSAVKDNAALYLDRYFDKIKTNVKSTLTEKVQYK